MQLTYTLPVDSLNEDFIEKIKDLFAGKNVNIIIEDTEDISSINQLDLYHKMEVLRNNIRHIKVSPDVDISALANEVNL